MQELVHRFEDAIWVPQVSWPPNLHPDFTLASCSHDGDDPLAPGSRSQLVSVDSTGFEPTTLNPKKPVWSFGFKAPMLPYFWSLGQPTL